MVSAQWTRWVGGEPYNQGQGNPGHVCADHIAASQCAEPIPNAADGALVGRIGTYLFPVRAGETVRNVSGGSIALRINDGDGTSLNDNDGALTVQITVTPSG